MSSSRFLLLPLLCFAFACEPPCPDGFDSVLDQCVKKTPKPHPCRVLRKTKEDALGGSVMSRVDLSGGNCFWMDQTETTVAEYAKWIEDEPTVTQWDANYCSWKKERTDPIHEPSVCEPKIAATDQDPFGDTKPIRCVDFCDADAFCRYAGKRLCHDFLTAGVGGPRGYDREWRIACTNDSSTIFPWGDDDDPLRCQTGQKQTGCDDANCGPSPVRMRGRCESNEGVLGLVGNVAEWVYFCNEKNRPETSCLVRGGGYSAPSQACDIEKVVKNHHHDPEIGFRCCADLNASERATIAESE